MKQLKPCPFCGGEAELRKIIDDEGTRYYVRCGNSHCDIYTKTFLGAKHTVIKNWNTRASNWHTGIPSEEGWYVWKGHDGEVLFVDTEYLPKGETWYFPNDVEEWMFLGNLKRRGN